MSISGFLEPAPAAILEHCLKNGLEGERVLIRVAADLDADLRFASRWVVVTDHRVLLIGTGDGEGCIDLSLREIRSVRVDRLIGGGRVVLRNEDAEIGVVCFTNSGVTKFLEVAAAIERLIRARDVGLLQPPDRTRCESCKRLLPEKDGVCPKCVNRGTTIRRLLPYVLPYRLTVVALIAVLLASAVAELGAPLVIRQILDRIVGPGLGQRLLLLLVGILLAARLAMWLGETGRGRLSIWLGARVTADLRKVLFDRVIRFPVSLIDKCSVGALLSRFVNDIARLDEFLGSGAPMLMISAVVLASTLALLLYMSPGLTLTILIPVPFIVLWTGLVWNKLRKTQDRRSSSEARLSVQISESLSGIRVVKAFCQEKQEYDKFNRHNDTVRVGSADAERESFVYFSVIYFLMNLGVLPVWYFGGHQVLRGTLTVGSLAAIISYLWILYWPLQWFGLVSNSLSQALTGVAQFLEIADSPVEEAPNGNGGAGRRIQGLVTFRDVTFGYDSGKPVLAEISFQAAPGEVIGIIGRSGTGKTTLMNLLCRFYEPNRGVILIDDTDIRDYRLDELRKQVAIVPQDMFLFNGTIDENIRYGRPGASFEEVIAAAKMAYAHRFILDRPDGYDSLVGSRGDRLSGGERQRIAIARAILADPRILILDEATSSLDVESERAIQRALARVSRNRTTFVIAHRLSTIRNVDRLIILDKGRIVETGTYEELLEHKGLLWEFANAYAETKDFQ